MAAPTLAGFTFLRSIGSGGFADVYLYRQHLPEREVAVKVLHPGFGAETAQAFASEANTMARLSTHPAIVTVYQAAIAADGRPYLVMEFCPLPNLRARSPLPVHETLDVMIRIAAAVETAHRSGIIHRDIKPANILTNTYGRPSLTDFGIAASRSAPANQSSGLSVPWAAPEVVDGLNEGDELADVYSLAATTYGLLAGNSPFELPGASNSVVDIIARIRAGCFTPLGRQDVPNELRLIIAQGMDRVPTHRPQSAAAFARQLQSVQTRLGLPVTPVEVLGEPQVAPRQELDATVRRRRQPAPAAIAPTVRQPAAVAATPNGSRKGTPTGVIVATVLGFILVSGLGSFAVYTAIKDAMGSTPAPSAIAAVPDPSPTMTVPAAWDPVAAGFRGCGDNVYGNGVTSCPFALNVAQASRASGGAPVLPAVFSPVTEQSYQMTCTTTVGWMICRGGNGAEVAIGSASG